MRKKNLVEDSRRSQRVLATYEPRRALEREPQVGAVRTKYAFACSSGRVPLNRMKRPELADLASRSIHGYISSVALSARASALFSPARCWASGESDVCISVGGVFESLRELRVTSVESCVDEVAMLRCRRMIGRLKASWLSLTRS